MSLQTDHDYIFIGTASLKLPQRLIASGPLLVTPEGISYGNFHQTDPFAGNTRKATTLDRAIGDVKGSVADLKNEYANLKDLSAKRNHMKEMLSSAQTIDELNRSLDEWAANDSGLIRITKKDISTVKAGFFTGLQITMQDGTIHKFRSGKLKAIKSMLGFA